LGLLSDIERRRAAPPAQNVKTHVELANCYGWGGKKSIRDKTAICGALEGKEKESFMWGNVHRTLGGRIR